jgi:membrane protease subunit HflC
VRRGIFGGLGLIIFAVVAAAAYFSVFIVDPTQQVLVLRFGEVVRSITTPGLYVKVPLIDNAVYIEKRILDLDTPELEVIAADQKRLVVDAFGRYRINNQLLFYQTVGSETIADARLSVIMNSAVRRVLGEAPFIDLVRDRREELMARITDQVNRESQRLGIDMVDVKIRRADLPEANSQAIYHRMQTERQREAAEIRAIGEQASRRIRAEADRDATVIVAEANKQSEEIRGDGDARRNQIFADAYGRDPDFFAFYRSMLAYQAGLRADDTRLLLSPDSDFFRYFGDPLGRPATAGGATRVAPTVPTTPAD